MKPWSHNKTIHDFTHSNDHDQFIFGKNKSLDRSIDFEVPGERIIEKSIYKNSKPIIKKDPTIPFRILCDRKTFDVKVFAGTFDSHGKISLESKKCLTFRDDKGVMDGFVEKSSILLYLPENEGSTDGGWWEVSVMVL